MSHKPYHFMTKKHLSFLSLGVLVLLVTVLGANTVTVSKYVLNKENTAIAVPNTFQFSSDYLRPESENKTYDVYTPSFDIQLYNSENGQKSNVDVGYTVTTIGGTAVPITGTITKTESTTADTATLTITPNTGSSSVTVSVTTTPYNKPLEATFHIKDAGLNGTYHVTDNSNEVILTIHTGTENTSLTINYDSSLSFNSTQNDETIWTNHAVTNTVTSAQTLESNATYTIKFTDSSANDYSVLETSLSDNTIILTST